MDLGIFTDEIVKNIDSAVTGSATFDTNNFGLILKQVLIIF